MSRTAGSRLSSQGASSRTCRLVLACSTDSWLAVGCQKARSGLSPVATLVCTPCSYGSGMVTTFTLAPVAFSNPAITGFGTSVEFCAAQMVRLVPLSEAVGEGQADEPLGAAVVVPAPGSEHAASVAAARKTAAVAVKAFFIELLRLSRESARGGGEAKGACGQGAFGGDGGDGQRGGGRVPGRFPRR